MWHIRTIKIAKISNNDKVFNPSSRTIIRFTEEPNHNRKSSETFQETIQETSKVELKFSETVQAVSTLQRKTEKSSEQIQKIETVPVQKIETVPVILKNDSKDSETVPVQKPKPKNLTVRFSFEYLGREKFFGKYYILISDIRIDSEMERISNLFQNFIEAAVIDLVLSNSTCDLQTPSAEFISNWCLGAYKKDHDVFSRTPSKITEILYNRILGGLNDLTEDILNDRIDSTRIHYSNSKRIDPPKNVIYGDDIGLSKYSPELKKDKLPEWFKDDELINFEKSFCDIDLFTDCSEKDCSETVSVQF